MMWLLDRLASCSRRSPSPWPWSWSGPQALDGGLGWLTWLRLGVGILLPIGVTVLAILASRAASLQASTGLLYIGLALVMAGSIAGASITYLTGVPV